MRAEAFDAIMARHHGEIFGYLRRLSGGAAEDLSQETFLRAYRAYAALPAGANVRAWLFAIATNLARNHSRGERRRRMFHAGLDAAPLAGEREGPEARARFLEARALVDAAIAELPLKQRAAFVLRKLHDLPYEEIARSLECSPDSARAHVFQALRKIRRTLNGRALLGAEDRE